MAHLLALRAVRGAEEGDRPAEEEEEDEDVVPRAADRPLGRRGEAGRAESPRDRVDPEEHSDHAPGGRDLRHAERREPLVAKADVGPEERHRDGEKEPVQERDAEERVDDELPLHP